MSDKNTLLMESKVSGLIPSLASYNRTLVETSTLLQSLRSHQETLNSCIQGGHNLYFLFSCLMESVSVECTQNCAILSNIKCELEIVQENGRFDVVGAFEILENSKKLLKYSRIIEQQNRLIQKSITNFVEVISHEKREIEDSFSNKVTSMISNINMPGLGFAAMATAAAMTAMDVGVDHFSSLLSSGKKSAVAGTIFGIFSVAGTVINVIDFCKDNNMNTTLEILNKLQEKLGIIQSCSDQFALLTNEIVDTFVNYTNSADKNVTYLFQTGTRPTILAAKMIKETTTLQKYFEIIEAKAKVNAAQFITLEHSDAIKERKKKRELTTERRMKK